MSRYSHQHSVLEPLVARLIEARTSDERDRALLDAAMVLSECVAGAVYGRGVRGWTTRFSSAERDALPHSERVEAVLEGELSPDVLPAGELVVSHEGLPWALALGGVHAPDSQDSLEGLLIVRSILGRDTDSADEELPPFPRPS